MELAAVRAALDAAAPDATLCPARGGPLLNRGLRGAWTRENRALLVSLILHFYEEDRLVALPLDLLASSVLSFVDAAALAALAAVSRETRSAAECDTAWRAATGVCTRIESDRPPCRKHACLPQAQHTRDNLV